MDTQQIIDTHFPSSKKELIINGCPVRHIAEKWGTPFYVYDTGVIDDRWQTLQNLFTPRFCIHYAVKANPNPNIVSYLLKKGAGVEIASAGELLATRLAGCPPQRIICAGPAKTPVELQELIRFGIAEIHVESYEELKRIAQIAGRCDCKASICFRVNPGEEAQGGAMRMGGKATSLGIDQADLGRCIGYAATSPNLDIRGVHLYTGTQILESETLLVQYEQALSIAGRVARQLNRPINSIDFGGGLGVPCFAHERPLDLDLLRDGVRDLISRIDADPLLSSARLILEPGRFLVAESGIYVTRVVDIKESRDKKFVVTDGGINHHLAASGNLGQMIKRNYPVIVANRLDEPQAGTVDIAGPLCTPLDILARSIDVPRVRIGDLIAVLHSGAYARSASPLGFLSHPSPPEIMVTDGTAREIRRRGSTEDIFSDITYPHTLTMPHRV